MCLHIFHRAQAAGTVPVHLQERNQAQTEQLKSTAPLQVLRRPARSAPEHGPAPHPPNQANNRVHTGEWNASPHQEKTISVEGMQELKPQLDKVPVTLSGKTHQQMQRWVGKALSRSKISAESEGVSPRELASTPSPAATVTARGDHVAQLGQHPHGAVRQAGQCRSAVFPKTCDSTTGRCQRDFHQNPSEQTPPSGGQGQGGERDHHRRK